VLVYDRATTVHTSKETQEELGRVFGKGNHEATPTTATLVFSEPHTVTKKTERPARFL
jgi:hypothetical protein